MRHIRVAGQWSPPWTRALAGLAIGMPALWIGGVHPYVVPATALVCLALWLRVCLRSNEPLRVPYLAVGLMLLAAYTLLQWAPIPGLREAVAPGLDAMVRDALVSTDTAAPAGLSTSPADTALESARLVVLAALVVVAAQLSWRVSAAFVAGTGSLVAAIGLAQEVLGLDRIYGFYAARHVDLAGNPALLGTFVNANHQSGLFLLGIFCAAGLALDQHIGRLTTRDATQAETHRDRFLASLGMLLLQLPALTLSLSRAAMLAFVIVLPFVGWLGLKRGKVEKRADPRRGLPIGVRLLVGAGVLVVIAIVAQHGALDELRTLWRAGALEQDEKITVALEAPRLLELSSTMGTARGTFIDLFAPNHLPATYALTTHLESTPMVAYVEWGPIAGGLALLGTLVWWLRAMWYGGHSNDKRPRRILLMGLLALAIQSAGDFSLEFLGVGAPAAVLAGALCAPPWIAWSGRKALVGGAICLAAAAALGALVAPHTWSQRPQRNAELLRGDRSADSVLSRRPLDGVAHAILARRALEAGAPSDALARAAVATRLQPGNLDAWIVRSEAERRRGDVDGSNVSLARALALVHDRPTDDLLSYLAARFPDPSGIAVVTPDARWPWRILVDGLIATSPAHADALCAARSDAHPGDSESLRLRVSIAITMDRPALALHHARLLSQVAPTEAGSHLAMVSALQVQPSNRNADIRKLLEDVISEGLIQDPAELGALEEALVYVLLRVGGPDAIREASKIAGDLVARPARADLRERRRGLARTVHAAVQELE